MTSNKIEQLFRDWQPIFDRMDDDYKSYRMEPFVPDTREGIEPEDAYTSNEQRTLADKIEAIISGSEIIIRVPDEASDLSQRQSNDNLERLCYGMLRNADKRLHKQGQPSIIPQLAWFSTVRGGFVALRAFLRKDAYGRTIEDILPLDPRQLVIEWGDNGIHCAAYRVTKTRRQIREKYPKFKFGDGREDGDETEVEVCYDYYYEDQELFYNGLLVDKQWAEKPQMLYGVLDFPIKAVIIGAQPRLASVSQSGEKVNFSDTVRDFGESVFASNRAINNSYNRLMSYAMTQTAQAADPPYMSESLSGDWEPDSTPFAKGAATKATTADEQKVVTLSTPDLRRDTQNLLAAMRQHITQGALPEQAYGILPAPLSSLALKQLGNNLEQKVYPRLYAVQSVIQYALEDMVMQFETGAYMPITVRGKRFDRVPVSGPVTPDDLVGHGMTEITMEPHFPEDENDRWQRANLAITPNANGQSLAPVKYARTKILKIADSDLMQNEVFEEMARVSDPIAAALQSFEAAQRAGDQALAARWFDKMKQMTIMEWVQVNQATMGLYQMMTGQGPQTPGQPQQPAMNGQQPQGQVPAANPNGVPPTFSPQANASPSPEAGFNTTAPRPGGMTPENQRLAAVGLERTV